MSAMASKATVVWLRDELRVHDNALLAEAARRGAPVLPVFCLDPRVFDASAKSDLGASQRSKYQGTVIGSQYSGSQSYVHSRAYQDPTSNQWNYNEIQRR